MEACVSPAGSPPVPATCGEGIAGFPSFSGPLIILFGRPSYLGLPMTGRGESDTFHTIWCLEDLEWKKRSGQIPCQSLSGKWKDKRLALNSKKGAKRYEIPVEGLS